MQTFAKNWVPTTTCIVACFLSHRLVGLVVKVSGPRAAEMGFNSHFRRGSFSSDFSDLKIGSPVVTVVGVRMSVYCDWVRQNEICLHV